MTRPAPSAASPPSADVRERLLDAARKRFGRYGVRKTTVDEIAKDAGLARATVYLHFRSKRDLYRELLGADTAQLVAEIEDAMTRHDDPLERIRALFRATLSHYQNNTVLRDAMREDPELALAADTRPIRGKHEARVLELLTSAIDEGVRNGTFRSVSPPQTAYVMFVAGRALIDAELDGAAPHAFDRLMRTLSDLVGYGLLR